ncbi:Inositol polyphosphate kinase family protein [Cryptosporidium felis]|nr:Inositol polyphosphate kinase family protein [Cryptosporidium felis]
MCIPKLKIRELFPLQILNVNSGERFMGSTLILSTKDESRIFKILKSGNRNELDFYISIDNKHLLRRHKIIPRYIKLAKLFETEHNGQNSYFLIPNSIETKDMYLHENIKFKFAIEMKNFLNGYCEPSIIDLKLGTSWLGELKCDSIYLTGNIFSKIFVDDRNSEEVNAFHSKMMNAIEKDEMMNDMLMKSKGLLKSNKQKKIIINSCQREIGIRIQGLIGDKIFVSRQRGKELTSNETMNYISEFFVNSPKLATLTKKKVPVLISWLKKQVKYRFIATSLVMVFDRLDREKCDIRWLDFTHAIKQPNEITGVEVNNGVIKGLKNVLKSTEIDIQNLIER